MNLKPHLIIGIILFFILSACSDPMEVTRSNNELPNIYPDYIGVSIPPNIAPLNFKLTDPIEGRQVAIFETKDFQFQVNDKKGQFQIPESKWSELLKSATGAEIMVTVCVQDGLEWVAYAPFHIKVAKEPIDPYIAFRLIEPGYAGWNDMGIYQRNLENYTRTAILENKMVGGDCVNCHSFCMQDPDQMMMHLRSDNAGTMIVIDGKIQKLNTKTEQTMSSFAYPSWHPSGKYIAYSVNDTKQNFHSKDKNRVEVFDMASDVVVYDIEKKEIISTSALFSDSRFESFPTFSSDGKVLYFSSAEACRMPTDFEKVKYSLCSIDFDPVTREFGSFVDTIFNARLEEKSASFPRASPDGKYLLYTKGDYGGFFIWHKEADLCIYNIETKEHYPLTLANSEDAESYHSWSSNSRWIVYSSRRIDGLYTRPFIAYINDEGKAEKAFVVPQKDVNFYDDLVKSYNIPEFVKGEVKTTGYDLAVEAKKGKGVNVKFSNQ